MSNLAVAHLAKSFGSLRVIDNVSFELAAGEALGIIGPNGAGKTTLFNLITGVLKPDTGNVWFDKREITVGRTKANDLVIPEPGVSSTHARLLEPAK